MNPKEHVLDEFGRRARFNYQMDAINDSNMHLCQSDKRIPNVLIQRYVNSNKATYSVKHSLKLRSNWLLTIFLTFVIAHSWKFLVSKGCVTVYFFLEIFILTPQN